MKDESLRAFADRVTKPASTFSNLLATKWEDDRETGKGILANLLTDRSAADKADDEDRARGWRLTGKAWEEAVSGLEAHEVEYLMAEGATGPRALERAKMKLEERRQADAVYAQHGVFDNIGASILTGLRDPAQWVPTLLSGGALLGVRAGYAAATAHKASRLAAASRAALAGPSSMKALVATDLGLAAADAGLWATAQDTLGGQVMGVTDYAEDMALSVATELTMGAVLHGGARGVQWAQRRLRGAAGDPTGDGLRGALRGGGLEPPPSPEPPDPELVKQQAAATISTAPEPQDPLGFGAEDIQKRLLGEPADAEPGAPGAAGEAPEPVQAPPTQQTPLPTPEVSEVSGDVEALFPELFQVQDFAPSPVSNKPGQNEPVDPVTTAAFARQAAGDSPADARARAVAADALVDELGTARPISGAKITVAGERELWSSIESQPAAPVRVASGGGWTVPKRDTDELVKLTQELSKFMPPGTQVDLLMTGSIGVQGGKRTARGMQIGNSRRIVLVLAQGDNLAGMAHTLVHEFGHGIASRYRGRITSAEWGAITRAFREWEDSADDGVRYMRRFAGRMGIPDGPMFIRAAKEAAGTGPEFGGSTTSDYDNLAEFTAEQFVKYVRKHADRLGLPQTNKALAALREVFATLLRMFGATRAAKWLDPEEAFEDFFNAVASGQMAQRADRTTGMGDVNARIAPDTEVPAALDITQYGQSKAVGAARIRSVEKQRAEIYAKAEAAMAAAPINTERLRTINQYVPGAMSAGLHIAGSQNPVLQWIAKNLLETTTRAAGDSGRSAAVRFHYLQQKLMGRFMPAYDAAWRGWAKANKVTVAGRLRGGEQSRFNSAVWAEIYRRREGTGAASPDPYVRAAADAVEVTMTAHLKQLKDSKTMGAGNLPDSAVGYIPQRLNTNRLLEASPDELTLLIERLGGHFNSVYGFTDPRLGHAVSTVYVNRARSEGIGLGDPTANPASNDLRTLREELNSIIDGIDDPVIRQKLVDHPMGATFTRRRLEIPWNDTFVREFFDTDIVKLVRGYNHRVSAEVALSEAGIPGWRGLQELRAVALSGFGKPVTRDEQIALDQIIAEFFGNRFDRAVTSRPAATLRVLTSAVRLGGAVWTQAMDSLNVAQTVGVTAALKFIPSIPSYIKQVRALKGGQPTGSILAGVDMWGGAVGMRDYLLAAPLDAPDPHLNSYTNEQTLVEKLVARIGYTTQTINFFRGFLAVQHRFAAEELLKRVVQDGVQGNTLSPLIRNAGFTDELVAAAAKVADIQNGRIMGFDPSKLPFEQADAFVQALHRGVGQMILREFVGERNLWAHNDWAKLFLQFRTFSISAAEKVFARNRAVAADAGGALDGYAYVGGLIAAQMAIGSAMYLARVHAQSIGRDDQEEYIERATSYQAIVLGATNYSAASGYLQDTLTVLQGLTGWMPEGVQEAVGRPTGGRGMGNITDTVPAVGLLNQYGRIAAGDADARTILRSLPGSNAPLVLPFINFLGDSLDDE